MLAFFDFWQNEHLNAQLAAARDHAHKGWVLQRQLVEPTSDEQRARILAQCADIRLAFEQHMANARQILAVQLRGAHTGVFAAVQVFG